MDTQFRERLYEVRRVIRKAEGDLARLKNELRSLTTDERFKRIDVWSEELAQRTFLESKERQRKKLSCLLEEKEAKQGHDSVHRLEMNKVVVNMSDRPLTKPEESILALGLNFIPVPTSIPEKTIIAETEAVARSLEDEDAAKLRSAVQSCLNNPKLPKSNLTKCQMLALQQLEKDKNIVILPADKGNATVVLNKDDYNQKMNDLLKDASYKRLRNNPTTKVEKKVADALKEVENKGGLSTSQRKSLTNKYSTPPQLYGLPKIHKKDTPLRPIVSSIDSPTYKLAKHLANILQPLVGTTSSYVKDSEDFVKKLETTDVQHNDIMVSFDVVSLFTKVPTGDALRVIKDLLAEDDTLRERTILLPADIVSLTGLCLNTTYFHFGGNFYEQVEGAAMGSPLSPVVANIYMQDFESRVLVTALLKPSLWLRYVDDTFVMWNYGDSELQNFLKHLNGQHDDIRFTMEREEDGTIPFLDVHVKRDGDKLTTSVYRKPTHTDRYLNYDSHHHPKVKSGIVDCLSHRAKRICKKGSALSDELKHVHNALMANGYPRHALKRRRKKRRRDGPGTGRPKARMFLPYIKGLSERIGRMCRPLVIHTTFTSRNTLRKSLTKVKGRPGMLDVKGVVYSIPCADCPATYIGETGRTLKVRMAEHKRAVKSKDPLNGIAVHVQKTAHNINWQEARILARENIWGKRRVLEALEIQQRRPMMNLDAGLLLDRSWTPYVHPRSGSHETGSVLAGSPNPI